MNTIIKCPHCNKVFFDIGIKECPYCKKDVTIKLDMREFWNSIFGGFKK